MNRFLKPIFPSLFILLIVLFALPQENLSDTIISSILVIIWSYSIFIYGIPSWNKSIEETSLLRNPLIVIGVIIVLPYTFLVISGVTAHTNGHLIVLYYLIPSILFSIPIVVNEAILNKSRSTVLILGNVLGAAIIWIGFDHRHTMVLFDRYDDMSYVMNSFWVAAVIMATFGQYSGIIITENPRDEGLKPTKYGVKIANIATPLASIIVIPFGLLTGFLVWNPVEFDVIEIIISFIGIYLTIALQEELVFRGVVLKELYSVERVKNNQYYPAMILVVVTLLFALTHWNNEVPEYVYHYFFAAFVAGLAYGISYLKAGMFGAMLSHTLIDWVWALLLKRA